MNDTAIENILFHAPIPVAPPELLKRLRAEIVLPAVKSASQAREWQNPLRRWFPALAFGVLMLSCAIMIAVQSSWGTNLKRQNEALRTATADLPQLREQHAVLDQAQAQRDELVQLRKDNQEVHQLQAEVATLRSLPQRIQQLQDENRRLAAAPTTIANAVAGASFFDEAQQQSERIQCVNNLKMLGLAARVWSGDNNEKYPATLAVMSNELNTVKILICPSDKARQSYSTVSFGEFQNDMSSYQFQAQPDDQTYPECIIAKCAIHHNYLLADGSVQTIDPAKVREVKKDGRLYLEPLKTGATWNDSIVQPIK